MRVKKDQLPTEGIRINGIKFYPGEAVEVDDEMGKALVARKGFQEVKTKKKAEKEDG